ncbi:hypothetical protein DSECCO2_620910 [anaerobic digester metagenome]
MSVMVGIRLLTLVLTRRQTGRPGFAVIESWHDLRNGGFPTFHWSSASRYFLWHPDFLGEYQ